MYASKHKFYPPPNPDLFRSRLTKGIVADAAAAGSNAPAVAFDLAQHEPGRNESLVLLADQVTAVGGTRPVEVGVAVVVAVTAARITEEWEMIKKKRLNQIPAPDTSA